MEKSWEITNRIFASAISPTDKLVALCVLSHINWNTGNTYTSRAKFAANCGISVRVVSRSLAVLKDMGMIYEVGYYGRFKLLSFSEVVNNKDKGDAHVTGGVTPAAQVEPQREMTQAELSLGRYTAVALARWGEKTGE